MTSLDGQDGASGSEVVLEGDVGSGAKAESEQNISKKDVKRAKEYSLS